MEVFDDELLMDDGTFESDELLADGELLGDDGLPMTEEEKQQIDLLCRNILNGVIKPEDLLITDLIAVTLRMQKMVEELDQEIFRVEQEISEQHEELRKLELERDALRRVINE